MRQNIVLCAFVLALAAVPASAQSWQSGAPSLGAWRPPVPTSALARASSWIDPQRLHVSTSVTVGGFSGRGTDALQVTSLSYQFRAPFALSVSLGNSWGPDAAASGRNPFFLEGLRMDWQPRGNTQFSFEYHQLRSPLQYGGLGYAQPRWLP